MSEYELTPTGLVGSMDIVRGAKVTGAEHVTHIAAVVQATDNTYLIKHAWSMQQFTTNLSEYTNFVIKTLVLAIRAQKRHLEYNEYNNAYLLDQMSEKEFEKISKTFALVPVSIDIDLLIKHIETLTTITQLDFNEAELADIYGCDESIIRKAINFIATQVQPA